MTRVPLGVDSPSTGKVKKNCPFQLLHIKYCQQGQDPKRDTQQSTARRLRDAQLHSRNCVRTRSSSRITEITCYAVANKNVAGVAVGRVIKIGAVVATRGPAALLGNSFVKAIQLAKEDLENTTHQYDLVIEEIPSPDKAPTSFPGCRRSHSATIAPR
jgi:hypothetical protein